MKNIYILHYTFRPCTEDYCSVPIFIIYHLPTTSTTDMSTTQPPTRWDSRVLCPRVKRPGPGPNNSHPSSADVQNEWKYTSTRPHLTLIAFMSCSRTTLFYCSLDHPRHTIGLDLYKVPVATCSYISGNR
jgi:hypothetical protein